jgi:hypothetical protein
MQLATAVTTGSISAFSLPFDSIIVLTTSVT